MKTKDKQIKEYNAKFDMFCAHALQGLLASGKFIDSDEDNGMWVTRERYEIRDEHGELTGKCECRHPVTECAKMVAESMMRELGL